jgi:hypothetical protein
MLASMLGRHKGAITEIEGNQVDLMLNSRYRSYMNVGSVEELEGKARGPPQEFIDFLLSCNLDKAGTVLG